jgi:glycosyltransferase involved in cell wall biosynthesis
VPEALAPLLVLVPVYREASNLGAVVAELRQAWPELPVLVVDDGSRDETPAVLGPLAARGEVLSLGLTRHVGLGAAVRAGLVYARALGFRTVIHLDGDGQHGPALIGSLLTPIIEGRADAVQGSRYLGAGPPVAWTWRRRVQRALGLVLSRLTRQRVTDPTSGCWAFGPRVVTLLADHHPAGYPEPALRLLLHRRGLRVLEVAVEARPRRGGRSSLTPARLVLAGARPAVACGVALLHPVSIGDGALEPTTDSVE